MKPVDRLDFDTEVSPFVLVGYPFRVTTDDAVVKFSEHKARSLKTSVRDQCEFLKPLRKNMLAPEKTPFNSKTC